MTGIRIVFAYESDTSSRVRSILLPSITHVPDDVELPNGGVMPTDASTTSGKLRTSFSSLISVGRNAESSSCGSGPLPSVSKRITQTSCHANPSGSFHRMPIAVAAVSTAKITRNEKKISAMTNAFARLRCHTSFSR